MYENILAGFDEHGCREGHLHYTLFSKIFFFSLITWNWVWIEPSISSNISCPQMGIYKSSNTYRPSIPVSTCSTSLWTLSIGCETTNRSELTFSSSCRHDTVPDVQVITSIKGLCLASWRTDHRFQRTIILYEQTRAFCLVKILSKFFLCIEVLTFFRFNHSNQWPQVGFYRNQVVQILVYHQSMWKIVSDIPTIANNIAKSISF